MQASMNKAILDKARANKKTSSCLFGCVGLRCIIRPQSMKLGVPHSVVSNAEMACDA
jgi:hypothetical protein